MPKGVKHYSVKALYGEVFDDDEVRSKTVQGLRADLGSARTRLHALDLAARLNKEIGSGQEGGAPVKILIVTNIEPEKLRGMTGQSLKGGVDAKKLKKPPAQQLAGPAISGSVLI